MRLSSQLLLMVLLPAVNAAEPKFTVHTAGAPPQTGVLQRIDKDWSVTLTSGSGAAPGADLLSLRQVGVALPPFPVGPHLVFANGDRLAGEVASVERGEVHFKLSRDRATKLEPGQLMTIPLSALAVIWFRAPPQDSRAEFGRRWTSERRRRDVVLLNNGDTRTGTAIGMRSPTAPFILQTGDAKETSIAAGQVVAVAMNTDLARTLRPRAEYGRLVLADGSRLSLLSATADAKTLFGKTLFGAEVKIPLQQIVSLDIRQGKAAYLSDLKPKRYEHTPFLGVRWPYEMDRSVAGRELRLAGNTYDKGVGLHSESRLTFNLAGEYRRFEAIVGLDDLTGQGGSVRVRVLVDGKAREVGDKELTSAAGPRELRVDVAGAKELTLVVEFGSGGDVCDHVNWADAKLIK